MNTEFYKLIRRFTNIIILILIVLASSTIIFFTLQLMMDEADKKEANLQIIKEFINTEYGKLSRINESIYLNKYFQQNLLDYSDLTVEEYVLKSLESEKKSLYLPETINSYLDQQNNDHSIVDVVLSLEPDFVISTGKQKTASLLSFSSKMEFLNEDFPKNQLILQVTPKYLTKELKVGQYYFELSDSASHVLLREDPLPITTPIETQIYRDITIKTYKDRNYFVKKAVIYSTLIYLLMIVILFIIKRMSKNYFNSYIVQFSDIVTSLEESNFSENIRIDTEDKDGELKIISEKINYYYDENEKYIESERENERLIQKAKFSSLQNQIEPHFLFNHLEFIRMKAFISGDDEISDSIFLLSQLYKNNTYQPDVICLEDELENIKLFLQLYKYRYANFDFIIDNQISNLSIPKLSLQPFAENFIKHGFTSTRPNIHFKIIGREDSNYYYITFKDNGLGVTNDQLIHLNNILKNDYDGTQHIGMKNSVLRLSFHFDHQVSVLVNSIENQSFSIELKIKKGED